MAERQPLVGRKGKTNSVVWKHFGFEESDSEQTKVLCKICYATVSATYGNTTNLFNHLKSKHRVIHDQALKEQKDSKMKAPRLLPPPHSPQLRTHFTMPPLIQPSPAGIKK